MAAAPTVSSAWVSSIARIFKSTDLDAPALFRDAGLDFGDIANPDARFDADRISRLWELALARSGNPHLALAMPDLAHAGSVDIVVHVMMTCPNLMAAIERFRRYMRIVSDVADIRLVREEGGYAMAMQLVGMAATVPRARTDFMVLTLLNILRWLTGHTLHPLGVDFPYLKPAHLAPYQLAFRCPLQFGAPGYSIHLSDLDLIAPLPTANSSLAELNDRMAFAHLARLEPATLSSRIKGLLVQRLPDGEPLRADIARELHIGERTLQRRLHQENTSFHALVESTRRELAERYLHSANVSLAQLAYLLGFADQTIFHRAFRRWFAMSPGEYRRRAGAQAGGEQHLA